MDIEIEKIVQQVIKFGGASHIPVEAIDFTIRNPATGLPIIQNSGIDIKGNPFGFTYNRK